MSSNSGSSSRRTNQSVSLANTAHYRVCDVCGQSIYEGDNFYDVRTAYNGHNVYHNVCLRHDDGPRGAGTAVKAMLGLPPY